MAHSSLRWLELINYIINMASSMGFFVAFPEGVWLIEWMVVGFPSGQPNIPASKKTEAGIFTEDVGLRFANPTYMTQPLYP